MKTGSVSLDKIAQTQLPDEMQKMSVEERKSYVEKMSKEREALRGRVVELARKRDSFIEEERNKRGDKDGFDKVAIEALNVQAKKKGFEISCK